MEIAHRKMHCVQVCKQVINSLRKLVINIQEELE